MANNLEIKISADVAELQAKFAIARAEANSLSSELNKLARASAGGIVDPASASRMQQVATQMLSARGAAASLSSQIQAAGVSVGGFGGQLESARGGIATSAREIHRLFEELRTGSAGGADVTIIRLASHLLGLGPAGLVAVGAIAGLTAGLGYMIVKAIEAGNALNHALAGAAIAGNTDITRAAIQGLADDIEKSAGLSEKGAMQIATALVGIPGIGGPGINAVKAMMSDLVVKFDGDSQKIAEFLTKMFSEGTSAAKAAEMVSAFARVGTADRELAADADRSGVAALAQAAKWQLLADTFGRAAPQLDQVKAATDRSISSSKLDAIVQSGYQQGARGWAFRWPRVRQHAGAARGCRPQHRFPAGGRGDGARS